MKCFKDLNDGDVIYVRKMSTDMWTTKEVITTTVRHVMRDTDEVSKMCGFWRTSLKIIEVNQAPKLLLGKEDLELTVVGHATTDDDYMKYYIDKNELIEDLLEEKSSFCEEIDGFIETLK